LLEFGGLVASGFVAELLELNNGAAQTRQGVGNANVLFDAGTLVVGVGVAHFAKEFANGDGGELEAGFGEPDWIGAFEDVGERFLAEAHFLSPELIFAPVLVPALFPFGEIVGREIFDSVAESVLNLVNGCAIFEHLIDLIADGFWEPGDLARAGVAGAGAGRGVGNFGVGGGYLWRKFGQRRTIRSDIATRCLMLRVCLLFQQKSIGERRRSSGIRSISFEYVVSLSNFTAWSSWRCAWGFSHRRFAQAA
jgi:hypothetical protein